MMIENRQLLVLTHLSQLLDLVTGVGGFIVPLVIWLTNKDDVIDMDLHGKAILNFRISMFIYLLICVPAIFLFGLGILGFIILGIFYLVYPIINALRASNNQPPNSPLSIQFLK